MLLMDKLNMMVKLKEKIYALKSENKNDQEVKRLEKLLQRLENTPKTISV